VLEPDEAEERLAETLVVELFDKLETEVEVTDVDFEMLVLEIEAVPNL
jgi:hypothetical protein